MKSGKNIDQLFKEKLQGELFEYQEADWLAAEQLLSANQKKRLGLIGHIANSRMLGLAAAFAVIIAAAYPLLNSSQQNPPPTDQLALQNHIRAKTLSDETPGLTTPSKPTHPGNQESEDLRSSQPSDQIIPNTISNNESSNSSELHGEEPQESGTEKTTQSPPTPYASLITSTPPKDGSSSEGRTDQLDGRETVSSSRTASASTTLPNGQKDSRSQLLTTSNTSVTEAPPIVASDSRRMNSQLMIRDISLMTHAVPCSISYLDQGLLLSSFGPDFEMHPLLPIELAMKKRSPAIWTLGAVMNHNTFTAISPKGVNENDYLSTRQNGEGLFGSYSYGFQVNRLSRHINWQFGLNGGYVQQNAEYHLEITEEVDQTTPSKLELQDRFYQVKKEGGGEESIYYFSLAPQASSEKTKTVHHKVSNLIGYFELPVFASYNLPFRSRSFTIDVGAGLTWQHTFGIKGSIVDQELQTLVPLNSVLNRNALYMSYGVNARYRVYSTWYVGLSARYKSTLGPYRFDSDFSWRQYQIGLSISKAIF